MADLSHSHPQGNFRARESSEFPFRRHGVKPIDAAFPGAHGAGLEVVEGLAHALLELASAKQAEVRGLRSVRDDEALDGRWWVIERSGTSHGQGPPAESIFVPTPGPRNRREAGYFLGAMQ
jgi:hypothetical protein